MEGEAGKLHRSLLGRAFSFPEPDSAFVMDGSSMGGWSRGRWGRERPLQLLWDFSYMCLARVNLTQGRRLLALARLGHQSNLQVTMQMAWARMLMELPLASRHLVWPSLVRKD